ncbi:MAG: hypothetical protein ACI87A_001209 [Planctomycetota bacterium]
MATRTGSPARSVSARLKQLIRHWTAGDLFNDETRLEWLRRPNGEEFMSYLGEQAASAVVDTV